MGSEIRYTLMPDNGRATHVGSAKEIVNHRIATDISISDMHLAKKPMVYWKDGLSAKAAEV